MQVVEDARAGTYIWGTHVAQRCVICGIGTYSVKGNIGENIVSYVKNQKLSEDNQRKSGEN
jgi:hypothetical protein